MRLASSRRHDRAVGGAISARSMLDPNFAMPGSLAAMFNQMRGEPEAAWSAFQRAMRLSPLDPLGLVDQDRDGFGRF